MRQSELQASTTFWQRVIRRTVLIFLVGLLLNASPFVAWNQQGDLVPKELSNLRMMGVLQRIALSFGLAAAIVKLLSPSGSIRPVLWFSGLLLLAYWAICWQWGAASDPYSLEGFIGTRIDRSLLGEAHLYRGEGVPFDPEGLLSTIPSVVQVLLGWCVGRIVIANQIGVETLGRLSLFAIPILMIAYLWQLTFPLNKKIWTSSFTLWTTGLATLGLLMVLYVIELRPIARQGQHADRRPLPARLFQAPIALFEAFGKNPLFIFVLSGLVPRVLSLVRWKTQGSSAAGLSSPLSWLYETLFGSIGSDPRLGSLLYSIALLAVYSIIVLVMDRRRIYIRL
jgi:predicted acyltransferase